MKRTNPSSGKKTHIPSDFKRLKAKVGKKAPQKANVTETKFQTASIQVRSQTINDKKAVAIKNGSGNVIHEMVSSQGKQLHQLLSQLNHPSPNVRLSALQGIKDAANHTPDDAIPNYLSQLVPAISKSMVDDDGKVRKMARSLFLDISTRILTNKDDEKMKPFLPLSLAYITSALHSLDQDVRYDGCIALECLCMNFGKDLNSDKELYTLYTTVPAFGIVFDDVSGGISSVSRRGIGDIDMMKKGNNTVNKKQKQSSNTSKAIGILKSFIAVMKVTTLSGQEEIDIDKAWDLNIDAMRRLAPNGPALLPSLSLPDMTYLPGGMTTNALVWNDSDENDAFKLSKFKLKGLKNLGSMLKSQRMDDLATLANKSLSISTQINLLSKLRNLIVEVTQKGNSHDSEGLAISSHEIEELTLLVAALRLLWNCHPKSFDNEEEANVKYMSRDGKTNEWKKFKQLAKHLLQIQLDVFPIHDPSGNIANKHNFDILNASLCCSISEFGCVLDPPGRKERRDTMVKSDWCETIFSFLLPQLKNENDYINASSSARITLMKVVEQLLFMRESGAYFLDDIDRRMELLSTLKELFFSDEQISDERLCRSIEGRRAVYILISLIAQFFRVDVEIEFDVDGEHEYKQWEILSQMAVKLPFYLNIWRGSYVTYSSLVVSTLISIIRRCKEPSTSSFCMSIRKSFIGLFESTSPSGVSVFEELPSFSTQKLVVSLIGMLGHPSKTFVQLLSQICARSRSTEKSALSEEMVDYIMNVVYSMKDTMSLETYCEFLIDSIGLSNHKDSDIMNMSENKEDYSSDTTLLLCSFDKAIARMCRYLCLVLHDHQELFHIVKPQLISWLDQNEKGESRPINEIKSRAAIITISCWSLLLGEECGRLLVEEDLREAIFRKIWIYMSSSNLFHNDNHQFISPIMVRSRYIMSA